MKSWDDIRPEPLVFEIGPKKYEIPELDYRSMLTVQKIKAGQATELDDAEPEDSWRLVMGPAWDEMVADNVPAEAISRAGLATLAYFEQGREVAEAIWEHGIDPKAVAAAILAQAEQSSPTATDEAPTTPSTASGSATTSPQASPTRRKAKAKASRSSSSAPSGSS